MKAGKNCHTITVCKKKSMPPNKKKCPRIPKCHPDHKRNKLKCRRIPLVNVGVIKKPVKILNPVRVVAKKLDIRNLTPVRDKVEIFGTDGGQIRPILTDPYGRLEIVPTPGVYTVFDEEKFLNWNVTDQLTPLPLQDTATRTMVSYAVINRGENPAIVRTEISPNSVDFAIDRQDTVPPNSVRVLVPNQFLKWTRLSVSAEEAGNPTLLDVYFQSQTWGS